MFDLSFSEIAFIAVIALVVVGPKELPVILKTVGKWIGKFKRLSSNLMQQLELDGLQDEVKTIQNDMGESFEAYSLEGLEDVSKQMKVSSTSDADRSKK